MKKKRIVSFVLVSIVLVATAIITSCSSIFEEDYYGCYSSQEKKEIKDLAKEYGLNVKIDNNYIGNTLTRSECEAYFEKLSSCLGDYVFIAEEKNGDMVFYSINSSSLRSANIENGIETIWSETGGNSAMIVHVTLIRYELTGNYTIVVTAEDSSFAPISTSQSNTSCVHVDSFFYFSSDVTTSGYGLLGSFTVSGSYNEITKSGNFSVITHW